MIDKCAQRRYNQKTMAEVAVLISTLRLGNCRNGKGNTAEEYAGWPSRIFLGLCRRCTGLSSGKRTGRRQGLQRIMLPCASARGLIIFVKED